MIQFGPLLGGMSLIPLSLLYFRLPVEAQEHIQTALFALEGRPLDNNATLKEWQCLQMHCKTPGSTLSG